MKTKMLLLLLWLIRFFCGAQALEIVQRPNTLVINNEAVVTPRDILSQAYG